MGGAEMVIMKDNQTTPELDQIKFTINFAGKTTTAQVQTKIIVRQALLVPN